MNICPSNICSGCAACFDACPKQCITMVPDKLATLHPIYDAEKCVECGVCKGVCPMQPISNQHDRAKQVFAAWSNDEKTRLTSASGGMASEIYKFALANGISTYGVAYEMGRGAFFIEINNEDDIKRAKSSKYVYSDAKGVYCGIKKKLIKGEKVIFIGLPCQVSALRHYVSKYEENLVTIDIICHGVAPVEYLNQHVESIQRKKGEEADELSFRDPQFGTSSFTFTLRNKGKVFYKKKVRTRDVYQLGYHRALIYRESCYNCRFASDNRVGDVTIGDYSGLGKFGGYNYPKSNVSSFLCNTEKGLELKKELEKRCTFVNRPVDEIFKYEKQLQHPSVSHPKRYVFTNDYELTGQFETAAHNALKKDLFEVSIHKGEWGNFFKWLVLKVTPSRLVKIWRRNKIN